MDASKKRSHIKQQAIMQKQQGGQTSKGSGSANLPFKRKQPEKPNRQPSKKPKVAPEPVLGLKAEGKKTVTKPVHGKGKGCMTGSVPFAEKTPILLREDSKYVLEQLSSIITIDDYEDLSNHATKAMRETGLFCIAQVTSQPSTLLSVNHI